MEDEACASIDASQLFRLFSRPAGSLQVAVGGAAACLAQQPGQVDLQRSRAYVRIGATGLGHEHGAEGRLKSGRLVLGPSANAGELVFDMTTFVTETAASRTYVGLGGGADASTAAKVTANMLGKRSAGCGQISAGDVPRPFQRWLCRSGNRATRSTINSTAISRCTA